MLDARALFYAILVSLLISLLSAALVQVTYFMNMQQTDQFDKGRLIRNVNSGIALLKTSDVEIEKREMDLYGDGIDRIKISRKKWGLFAIGTSSAFVKKIYGIDTLSKVLLFGDKTSDFVKYGLYVTDQIRPISLVGNTEIKGKTFLPKAGIKRGNIGGKTFIGNQMIEGERKESKTYLPKLDWNRLSQNIKEIESITGIQGILEDIKQSFVEETVVISGKVISLQEVSLKGNIIVRASEKIIVGHTTELEDVILIAPNILIKDNFQGSFQAFAKKEIKVEENCYLEYPTVLFLSKETQLDHKTLIEIGKRSRVEGMILAYEKRYQKHSTHVSILENTEIVGEVFVKGTVDLRGEIWGSLSCKEFQVRTQASTYNNYLLDGKINRTKLPKQFVSPMMDEEIDWEIIKYIE